MSPEPIAQRRRSAKAALLLQLAMAADRWAAEVTDTAPGTLPFAQWDPDEPMRQLAALLQLAPYDLSKVSLELADELERRAERLGIPDLRPGP